MAQDQHLLPKPLGGLPLIRYQFKVSLFRLKQDTAPNDPSKLPFPDPTFTTQGTSQCLWRGQRTRCPDPGLCHCRTLSLEATPSVAFYTISAQLF